MQSMFDFISIMTYFLSMNRAYKAHIGKGCTLSQCRVMKGVFNIDYTLGSGRTPGVSILDSECYETWLQIQRNNADEFSYIACVVRLNSCNLVLNTKEQNKKVVAM